MLSLPGKQQPTDFFQPAAQPAIHGNQLKSLWSNNLHGNQKRPLDSPHGD
jgi:hypothetical protein